MGWLIAALLLLALLILPLTIRLAYDEEGPHFQLGIGFVRIPVFPNKKEEKPEKTQPKAASGKKQTQKSAANGGKLADFWPLMETVLSLVSELRRRLVITNLSLKIRMAGDDPCDLSIQYGRTWAAIGNLLPLLERLFVLKKRDIDVICDYTASQSSVLANAVLRITFGRLLWIAIFHGRHVLKEFLKIYNTRKGGTVK